MFKVFDSLNRCNIVLKSDLESVKKATADLVCNLERLSGQNGAFITSDSGQDGIVIMTVGDDLPKNVEVPTEAEGYTITIKENAVYIIGFDELGTIYGIYGFATNFLNISPVYRLADVFPKQTESLELKEQLFSSPSRSVRFRGWFLNDEDLLTDFKISGGTRNINYPFYQNVMDTEVLDMVLETALRLEINLIIPGSFIDIDNPAEEKLVETSCKRGLYVSQHHIEPMGVSYFSADNYLKNRNLDNETISFITNRERMVEIWQYYATKWAKYGKRVVWQLGLRGKGDNAVWRSDPNVPTSNEQRGSIISDAISTQWEIVRDTLNSDSFYSTATLWNEGSVLYGNGYLTLPENTIPVFADFGVDQMFGEDLYNVALKSNHPYGVYYHAAFWHLGPHFAEGCNPKKMAYCYNVAASKNLLCYSILNISNVRPLHVSAMMNAKIFAKPTNFNAKEELLNLDIALFGKFGEKVNNIRQKYYARFADFGEAPLRKIADLWCFYYHDYQNLPFVRNAVTDGQLMLFGRYILENKPGTNFFPSRDESIKTVLKNSASAFSALYKEAEELESELSQEIILYFRQFLKYQILHMQLMAEWCVALMETTDETLTDKERTAYFDLASSKLKTILQERKILEVNGWENWHRGDKKINIEQLLATTEDLRNGAKP